jgi:antitoxin PrlF
MAHHSATLTSKGQITLPIRLRNALQLKPGDQVTFVEESNGDFRLQGHSHSLADLRGIVKTKEKIRAADVDGWIAEARAARARRSGL